MNKQAFLAQYLLGSLGAGANIKAGVAGAPHAVPEKGQSTGDMLGDKQMGYLMRGVYSIGEAARDEEAKRLSRMLFGTDNIGNPTRGFIAKALANNMYNRKVQPFLDAMQREIAGQEWARPMESLPANAKLWERKRYEKMQRNIDKMREQELAKYKARFRDYLNKSGWKVSSSGKVLGLAGNRYRDNRYTVG